jgi:hypothetical protein
MAYARGLVLSPRVLPFQMYCTVHLIRFRIDCIAHQSSGALSLLYRHQVVFAQVYTKMILRTHRLSLSKEKLSAWVPQAFSGRSEWSRGSQPPR